jgi:hypothetical protein
VTFPPPTSGSASIPLVILDNHTYCVPVTGPVNLYTPGEIFTSLTAPFFFTFVTLSLVFFNR